VPTRKLSPDDELELARAYEEWDPNGEVDLGDIAKEYGVSRQTVYSVIRKHGIQPKSHREGAVPFDPLPGTDLIREMARQALEAQLGLMMTQADQIRRLRGQLRDVGEEPSA